MPVQQMASGDSLPMQLDAETADAKVSVFEQMSGRYVVRRYWDPVSYTVAVHRKGERWPFMAWTVGLDDTSWLETESEGGN